MGAQAHHHEESFISKYVFSHDHKMISKQFLVTAIVMGIVAVMLSVFFRLQLGWPGESFAILETFLGKWAPGGVLDRNAYLALVTILGTIMVFFVLTGGLSGTFSNLLSPLQIGRPGHGFRFSQYAGATGSFSLRALSCSSPCLWKVGQLPGDGLFIRH